MKSSELIEKIILRLKENRRKAENYEHPATDGKFKSGYLDGITDSLIIVMKLKGELDESE